MKITKIDGQACDTIRKTLNGLLSKSGLEGVHFEVGSMSYSDNNVKIKLTASVEGENGDVKTPEAIAYGMYAGSMGLPPNGLGLKFTYNGQEYALSGLSTRRCKNCVHAKRLSDGATVRLSVALAVFALSPDYCDEELLDVADPILDLITNYFRLDELHQH